MRKFDWTGRPGVALAAAGTLLLGLTLAAWPRHKERAPPAARVEVDAARGEVRIACRFARPDRVLEVFACHESGPIHEALISFEAEGEEIVAALRQAGFRGPEYWSATSPRDLRLTGGDRAVAWLRWEWKGKVEERAAEEVLVEEGTGSPFFLRGFTFAADARIPQAVEITIGGKTRQGAAYSILYHPHDLPEMLPWVLAPEADPRALADLPALRESRAPCTLIVRRIRGETELVELALAREQAAERRAVRERQRPIAAAIDASRREFETLVGEVKALLEEGERSGELGGEERRRFQERIGELLPRGSRLAAEIRESYFKLWNLEEEQRVAWCRRAAELDGELKERVAMAHLSGFRFELAIAAKRREQAALGAVKPSEAARASLVRGALEKEIEALEAERERRWAGFKLERETRPRLRALDPVRDEYTYQLFREEELRILADMQALRSRAEAASLEARGLRAGAAEGGAPFEDETRAWRGRIEARSRLAAAEVDTVDLLEKVRWARNPPRGIPGPEEKEEIQRLEGELRAAGERTRKLRAALEEAGEKPAESGDAAPRDGGGKPLFQEDVAG